MTTKTEARAQELVQYTHAKVRDRYDADLLMAGFEDGAVWQASRKVIGPEDIAGLIEWNRNLAKWEREHGSVENAEMHEASASALSAALNVGNHE